MPDENKVQARKLETVHVRTTDKPDVMVLQFETAGGVENFAVTREAMKQIGDHLTKNAASTNAAEGHSPKGVS